MPTWHHQGAGGQLRGSVGLWLRLVPALAHGPAARRGGAGGVGNKLSWCSARSARGIRVLADTPGRQWDSEAHMECRREAFWVCGKSWELTCLLWPGPLLCECLESPLQTGRGAGTWEAGVVSLVQWQRAAGGIALPRQWIRGDTYKSSEARFLGKSGSRVGWTLLEG